MTGQNCIVAFIGRKGSGKSTLALNVFENCPRIVVFDPLDEYEGIPNRIEGEPDELEGWFDDHKDSRYAACRYVPDDMADEFSEVCEVINRHGNVVFVIEETPLVTPSASFIDPAFDRLVRTGRHRNIDLIFIGQRSTELARRCTAAADYLIYFSTREPRDVREIAERVGDEQAEKVSKLPMHEYLCWDVIEWREAKIEEVQDRLGAVKSKTKVAQ